jgi:hypothetical protein
MGLFRKLAGADARLLKNGTAALGWIFEAALTGGPGFQGGPASAGRMWDINLLVLADGVVPYQAVVRQFLSEGAVPGLESGTATCAIRVDPKDPQRVALDVSAPRPVPRVGHATGPGTPAYVLEHGRDAAAVIVSATPLGYLNYLGYPMYYVTWTVMQDGRQAYQAKSATAVPPKALPLVYPGSKVHVKLGATAQEVAGDFSRGAAQ